MDGPLNYFRQFGWATRYLGGNWVGHIYSFCTHVVNIYNFFKIIFKIKKE